MRAAVLRRGRFELDDFPEPTPSEGQVLVAVKACGICGSDLGFARHGEEITHLRNTMERMPARQPVDFEADIFMGHEFAAEILRAGPNTASPPPGTLVTSLPFLTTPTGRAPIVCSNTIHGGFGERMLLSTEYLRVVPGGLSAEHAALCEPMTVGLHAVVRSDIAPDQAALVVGAGAVGQAVIAALALRGVEAIIASDFSTARRATATAMGAHQAVDPSVLPVFDAWDGLGSSLPPVVFVAVAAEGLLNELMRVAPRHTKFVVIGALAGLDPIASNYGLVKELTITYAYGYSVDEFDTTLAALADGRIDVAPLITGRFPLAEIDQAFGKLSDPDLHCKILVTP